MYRNKFDYNGKNVVDKKAIGIYRQLKFAYGMMKYHIRIIITYFRVKKRVVLKNKNLMDQHRTEAVEMLYS